MRAAPSLIAALLLPAALAIPFVILSVRRARAQAEPPSLRMLLNLDLFTSRPQAGDQASGRGQADSTLDQIRTLTALGYLGTNGKNRGRAGQGAAKPDQNNGAADIPGQAPAAEATP